MTNKEEMSVFKTTRSCRSSLALSVVTLEKKALRSTRRTPKTRFFPGLPRRYLTYYLNEVPRYHLHMYNVPRYLMYGVTRRVQDSQSIREFDANAGCYNPIDGDLSLYECTR